MRNGRWIGLVLAVVLLAGAAALAVRAKDAPSPPDLSGTWRLNLAKSDLPGPRGDHRMGMQGHRWGGHMGGNMQGMGGNLPGVSMQQNMQRGTGGWQGGMGRGGHRGSGQGRGEGGYMRHIAMLSLVRIEQHDRLISIADSTGAVRAEIRVDGGGAAESPADSSVLHLTGHWDGDKLVVTESTARGTVTGKANLDDKGRRLVVNIKHSMTDGPTRDAKLVYDREAS